MFNQFLVTGASGNLGREVVKVLLSTGYVVKAGTRDVRKIQPSENLEAVQFDYADPTTFDAALEGIASLFLVAPPMDPEAPAKLIPFLKKAKKVGIKHVVFNSALGVDHNEQAPLRIVERALMGIGVPYTILRPNFFMENFSTGFIAPMIKHQNGMFLAAGDGKTSFISTKDIARVVVAVLAKEHYGKAYNLTGPEVLDHHQVAKIISEAIGREVVYLALTEGAMLQGAREKGMPESAVQYMAVLYSAVRAGYMALQTGDVEHITGRKPLVFSDFVLNNKNCWL